MLLAVIALAGIGLAAVGPMWAEETQRERERELLRVGEAYARALASYYHSSAGAQKRYPKDLAELVYDRRFAPVRRHLRTLYPDPLDPARPWGLILAPDGGISGVFSQDERRPWRQLELNGDMLLLPAAARYSDWAFMPATR